MRVRPALALACVLVVAGCSSGPSTVTGTEGSTDTESSAETAGVDPQPTDGASTPAATAATDGQPTPGASTSAAGGGATGGAAGGGAAGGGGAPAGAGTYTGARYGFSVTIPQGFTKADEIGDRGAQFNGPNEITLKAYGSDNLLQQNPEQVCQEHVEAYLNEGGSATSHVDANRCTVTGTLAGKTYQMTTWVGPISFNHLEVAYTDVTKAPAEAAMKTASAGFTPGDLNASH